jgi:hypothetical protein
LNTKLINLRKNSKGHELKRQFLTQIDPNGDNQFLIEESEEFFSKLNITLEMALVTEIKGTHSFLNVKINKF